MVIVVVVVGCLFYQGVRGGREWERELERERMWAIERRVGMDTHSCELGFVSFIILSLSLFFFFITLF